MRLRALIHCGQAQQGAHELLQLQHQLNFDPVDLGIVLLEANVLQGQLKQAQMCLEQLRQFDPSVGVFASAHWKLLRHSWSMEDCVGWQQLEQAALHCRLLAVGLLRDLLHFQLLDESKKLLQKVIDHWGLDGDVATLWFQLLAELGEPDEFLQWQQRLPADSGVSGLELLLAEAFINANRLELAESHLRRLVPRDSKGTSLLSECLRLQGRFDEALICCQQLPQPQYGLQLAHQLLALGHWSQAWPLYEQRSILSAAVQRVQAAGLPERTPALTSLVGKHVLLYEEQGLGDTVMMCSVLEELQQQAASITLLVQPRLQALLAASFPQVAVKTALPMDSHQAFQAVLPLSSLGQWFRPSPQACPGRPCLTVPRAEQLQARQWLAGLPSGLKVGLAWRGGGYVKERARRSIPLDLLQPLLTESPVCWVNLQYGLTDQDYEQTQPWLHHYDGVASDLTRTAALIQALDLVITVQQTTVHLAGALGTPAWVLLPVVPEWRYGTDGPEMPWYGSVELFRSTRSGGWKPLLHERLNALRHWRPDGPQSHADVEP
ncbi:hypothetical protein [Synechococcus sp. Minos11]|uniref:hypothetical protein n=1 Tax=Synechococcus sp. Minos11 TaxID=221341 RepID=UPI001647B76F|nr:hypothetical protein [Synechococcus sp. Minos11]